MPIKNNSVVFLHYGGDQHRGTEVCLILALKAIAEAGYDVSVVCNDKKLQTFINSLGYKIHCFEFPEIMIDGEYRSFPIFRYLKALFRLRKIIKSVNLVYCSGGLPCQLAVPIAFFQSKPLLCHFHHPASKRYFYFWLLHFVDNFIVPSEFTKSVVVNQCKSSVEVFPNAVDLNQIYVPNKNLSAQFRSKLGIKNDDIVIGQIGHLSKHKNHDLLIRAFKFVNDKVPNTKLFIVGDGPERDSINKLVMKSGLEGSVSITGYVPAVLPFLQNLFDINVLASSEEGFGITLIEAAGCEVASVASDCTGMKNVVINGITGCLFEPGNVQSLSASLLKLVRDKKLLREMGKSARENALEKYSITIYNKNIVTKISNLIGAAQNK